MTPECNPIWSWNFGDGSGQSSQQNPTYVYSLWQGEPGFTVTLVASNLAGNSTYSIGVVVTK
jgi:PKD repeat protein